MSVFAVQLTHEAQENLQNGYWFYDAQEAGLGNYFLGCLSSDIDALSIFAGIHVQALPGIYRTSSKRFPYSVYYQFDGETVTVIAIMDERQNPDAITRQLKPWQ